MQLLFFFFFFPPSSTTGQGQSEQECETLLNSADGSQPSYQLARLHPLTHSGEHLKDPCCQDVRVAGRTASCLCFNTSSREQTTSQKKKKKTCPDMIYVAQLKKNESALSIADIASVKLQGTRLTRRSKQTLLSRSSLFF